MEQDTRHHEWAKLKLVGRPLITSRAWGKSFSEFWVAIRPLPRLVHIYHNSKLHDVLRFPEDPIFLLFAHPEEQDKAFDDENVSGSLLVISSNGSIWWVSLAGPCKSLSDRPLKRLKQTHSRGRSAKTNTISGSKEKTQIKDAEDEWDLFGDTDIYKDVDLCPSDIRSVRMTDQRNSFIVYKPLKCNSFTSMVSKQQGRFVTDNMLIGKITGANLAVIGPESLIAVMSPSASPILINRSLPSIATGHAEGASACASRPSCLLFISVKNSKYRTSEPDSCVSVELFKALSQPFTDIKPEHLLLQGNMEGQVYMFPVQHPSHLFSPVILFDLKEPVSKLFVAHLYEGCEAIIVVSTQGRITAVVANETQNLGRLFLGSFGVSELFQIDLKDAISIYDWRVDGPVVSPVMNGSHYLYFCSASNVFVVDFLEHKDLHKSSYLASANRRAFRNSLSSMVLPINDVIIALAGKGPVMADENVTPLVVLTSRGRLIAVHISDRMLTSQDVSNVPRKYLMSWNSEMKKEEDSMKALIDEISEIEDSCKVLQDNMKSLDLAIAELSSSLQLAFDVLRCRSRHLIQAAQQSISVGGLSCSLEIRPVTFVIPTERLCFVPERNTGCGDGECRFRLHLKVTLSNQTAHSISPFWTLALEIQDADESKNKKRVYFSSTINDGYGLSPGSSCDVEFEVPCSEKYLSPHIVSIFLLHIHDNHDKIIETTSNGYVIQKTESKLSKYLRQLIGTNFDSFTHVNPGAVSLILARFRVDTLSIIRPPKDGSSSMKLTSHLKSCQGLPLGVIPDYKSFLGKFQLKYRRKSLFSELSAVLQKWEALHLGDMVKCFAMSKDGRELSGVDPSGNHVRVMLHWEAGINSIICDEVRIATQSLLLGFLAREAVQWRLTKVEESYGLKALSTRSDSIQDVDKVLNFLIDINKKVEASFEDPKDTRNMGSIKLKSPDMLNEIHDIVRHIVDIYTFYREIAASV